jgi:hypothetical protein
MSTVQKVGLAIVAVGAITALTLPGRQTAQVLRAGGGVFQGALGTAILG